MSSERLPGKVLRPLAGKPALDYVLERISRAQEPDLFLIATSADPSDDPIDAHCRATGVPVHRGSLEDVAGRFAEALDEFGLAAFARVTADSPLLDQRVLDRAVARFREGDFDVVTNVFPSTFPSGESVEVVSRDAFAAALPAMSDPGEREHVTLHFYRHPERFRIENLTAERDDGELDLSLDTVADAAMIEGMLARMEKPHWEYTSDELVELHRAVSAEPRTA